MALIDKLNAIGNAIRAKTGKTQKLTLDEMPAEISSIVGGGTEDLNAVLTEQEELIDELKSVLDNKASGGGGDLGGLTKYAKVYATPQSTTSFVIENPLGGIARKVTAQRTVTTTTSSRKIQQYIADLDLRMGVLYAVATSGNARYTVTAVDSGVNNGNFMMTEGKITLYRFNSSNTWDSAAEYEVEIWQ